MTTGIRRAETPDNLEELHQPDTYLDWQESEGVKVVVDFAFENLKTLELGDWERKGGRGAIINIPGTFLPNDTHVVEIQPGGKSEPERHLYEEMVYVLSGRGATRPTPSSRRCAADCARGCSTSSTSGCYPKPSCAPGLVAGRRTMPCALLREAAIRWAS